MKCSQMSFPVSRVGLTTFLCLMKYYLVTDSALHSAPYSPPYSKIQKVSVLVSSLTTTNLAIIFTQEILHLSNISKRKCTLQRRRYLPFTTFLLFLQWIRCAMSQINSDILTN